MLLLIRKGQITVTDPGEPVAYGALRALIGGDFEIVRLLDDDGTSGLLGFSLRDGGHEDVNVRTPAGDMVRGPLAIVLHGPHGEPREMDQEEVGRWRIEADGPAGVARVVRDDD